ncbi:MAG: hypothetical protein ACR2RA_26345, partial [Geminicoccaceae bacterium]
MSRCGPVLGLLAAVAGLTVGFFAFIDAGLAEEAGPDPDRAAAADGDAGALLRLATRYETGDAVPVDLDHAAALLEQAAMRG